jgi:hypothetical protein
VPLEADEPEPDGAARSAPRCCARHVAQTGAHVEQRERRARRRLAQELIEPRGRGGGTPEQAVDPRDVVQRGDHGTRIGVRVVQQLGRPRRPATRRDHHAPSPV